MNVDAGRETQRQNTENHQATHGVLPYANNCSALEHPLPNAVPVMARERVTAQLMVNDVVSHATSNREKRGEPRESVDFTVP